MSKYITTRLGYIGTIVALKVYSIVKHVDNIDSETLKNEKKKLNLSLERIIMKQYLHSLNFLLFALFYSSLSSQIESVRLNQVGFCKGQPKYIVITDKSKKYSITNSITKRTIVIDSIEEKRKHPFSNEEVSLIDISFIERPGNYTIKTDYDEASFQIKKFPYESILRNSIRAYYLTRASQATEEQFAGEYNRPLAHPDDSVLIHSSAASEKRPENTVIKSPGGWYDAGDYNKYVVNSGITTYTLLRAYDDFNKTHKKLNLNIPKSGDDKADLLDEIEYNINWMLTMQDPNDGGVYHKLTTKLFSGFVKPEEATEQRYVVKKSTTATLDFCAVICYYARLIKDKERKKELISLAESAYQWAKENPKAYFKNPQDIKTGEYGDKNTEDEFFWAEAELFLTTKDTKYNTSRLKDKHLHDVPAWPNVKGLGVISLANSLTEHRESARSSVNKLANKLEYYSLKNAYGNTLGRKGEKEFNWGSNSTIANQAFILIEAYRFTKDQKYLSPIFNNLYYLLGQNPTGYCFVTGYGTKRVMNPHHRPSGSDGVIEPYPGFLAGGPNKSKQDIRHVITYNSDLPALSYTDDIDSYASNEVAINWNAPLVYLLSFAHSHK